MPAEVWTGDLVFKTNDIPQSCQGSSYHSETISASIVSKFRFQNCGHVSGGLL